MKFPPVVAGDWLVRGRGRVGRRWWRARWRLERANGGNCSIRAATRRRHAVAMRLMVQNPPLGGGVWPGERWLGGQATGCGPADRRWRRAGPWLERANGGNCSIRGATRRRHAVAMRLMVQNPPLGGGVWPGERWLGGQATGCGQEGGPRAPGALLPGAAGEAAPWGRGWGGVAFDARARGEGGADDGVAVVPARANGGNCSIRAATRRRHAVAMRLMVQTPRWAAGCGPAGGGRAGRRPGVARRVGRARRVRCCRVQLARRPGGLWPDALLPAFAAGRGPVIRRWWRARWRLARANGWG